MVLNIISGTFISVVLLVRYAVNISIIENGYSYYYAIGVSVTVIYVRETLCRINFVVSYML